VVPGSFQSRPRGMGQVLVSLKRLFLADVTLRNSQQIQGVHLWRTKPEAIASGAATGWRIPARAPGARAAPACPLAGAKSARPGRRAPCVNRPGKSDSPLAICRQIANAPGRRPLDAALIGAARLPSPLWGGAGEGGRPPLSTPRTILKSKLIRPRNTLISLTRPRCPSSDAQTQARP